MKTFLKNISYSLVSNLSNMILGIIAILVFPKFIGVDGYGYYQLFIFYSTIMIITALGWGEGYYLRIGGKKYEELDKEQESTHFWMMTIIQTVIYALILLVVLLQSNESDKRLVYILSCVWAFGSNPRYFLKLVLQATNSIRKYAIVTITERLISILLTLVLIALGYRNYVMLLLLEVIGRYVSLAFALYFCRDALLIKPRFTLERFREIRKFILSGSMLLFASLSSTLIIGVVRLGIENFWSITEFSKVSLTISISNLALQCINAIAIVMFPTLRRMKSERQREVYPEINTLLMVGIFAALVFYNPAAKLLELWLPQYADSIKYAAILLPMCVYECKNAVLVVTYIKTLRCEKILLWSNLVALAASCLCTMIFIYGLHSIELAMLSIFVVLMFRCNISEYWLNKTLKISLGKDRILEMILCVVFIAGNWYMGMHGVYPYIVCYFVYLFAFKRRDLMRAMRLVRR